MHLTAVHAPPPTTTNSPTTPCPWRARVSKCEPGMPRHWAPCLHVPDAKVLLAEEDLYPPFHMHIPGEGVGWWQHVWGRERLRKGMACRVRRMCVGGEWLALILTVTATKGVAAAALQLSPPLTPPPPPKEFANEEHRKWFMAHDHLTGTCVQP